MKAEIIKATNSSIRITFEVSTRNLILVSKMPLETDPFKIKDDKNNTIFSLRIGAVAQVTPKEVVLTLPTAPEELPTVNIPMDSTLSLDEIKYLTAIYKEKLTIIETQILKAVETIEKTIKNVEVI